MKRSFAFITILLLMIGGLSLGISAGELEEGVDYFSYEGSGDDFVAIEKPEEVAIMHIVGNQAGGYFGVQGFDEEGSQTNLFVNTTDYYEGTVALDFDDENTTHLEISAETGDDWSIGIFPIGATEYWVEVPGEINGENDSIVIIEGDPTMADIEGNEAGVYFGVKGWLEQDGRLAGADLLVNVTETYEGTVRLDSNTFVLEINAVGDWSLRVQ